MGTNNHTSYRAKQRIFNYLVDHAAHFHRVYFSIWGTKRSELGHDVEEVITQPSYQPGRFHSCTASGVLSLTGNPFSLNYGRMVGYPNVPPLRLEMRSVACPLTCCQVRTTVQNLVERGARVVVSKAELTFDLSAPFSVLDRHAFSTARHIDSIDKGDGRTVYFGSAKSPAQAKIYEKTYTTTRVEFTLKRPALRKLRIHQPEQLLKLATFDIWQGLRFLDIPPSSLQSVNRMNSFHRVLFANWPLVPLAVMTKSLTDNYGLKLDTIAVTHPLLKRLQKMQRQLIW